VGIGGIANFPAASWPAGAADTDIATTAAVVSRVRIAYSAGLPQGPTFLNCPNAPVKNNVGIFTKLYL
jgi:hypothetical protein